MKRSQDHLFELLPAIHRMRDAEQGYRLRAILRILAEQCDVVDADIGQLYRNWFIETCEDWVVPYIGDLIGYRPIHDGGVTHAGSGRHASRNRLLVPRQEIAKTIAFRRRKGTLALLEELAFSVAGWPARAVEFYPLLGWVQNLNHQRPNHGGCLDLRKREMVAKIHGPFDEAAHTVDLRHINSQSSRGLYNVGNVGLFIWRLRSYSVTYSPAACIEEQGAHCYTFSVLGNDTPLYNTPVAEADPAHIAGEINLPLPIRPQAFEEPLGEDKNGTAKRQRASQIYYGEKKSVAIWAKNWPRAEQAQSDQREKPIPPDRIIPSDLSGWKYRAPADHVLVDTSLGRIMFPERQAPSHGVYVSYYYGFSADMGGGEYERPSRGLSMISMSQFHRADFRRPKEFVTRLKASLPASDFIRARLSEVSAARLAQYQMAGEPSKELLDGLVADLNRVLYEDALYDPLRMAIEADAELNANTELQHLIRLWNQDARPVDLVVRFNRVLLETQFPHDLAKSFIHYLVSGDDKRPSQDDDPLLSVFDRWEQEKPRHAVIEIVDSDAYLGRINLELEPGQTVHLKARNGTRPVIRLLDWKVNQSDAFKVRGGIGSRVVLDGLLITGRGLIVSGQNEPTADAPAVQDGDICEVVIRHTTLVPGWDLECDCTSKHPNEPSVELVNTMAQITIERSIIGSIYVTADEVRAEPVRILITDSIVDATSADRIAIGTATGQIAHANVTVIRSTVIGTVRTHSISLAENAIFVSLVTVARRQVGCCRFSYVPSGSRSPRRYKCQPDEVERAVLEQVDADKISKAQRNIVLAIEQHRVAPQFNSLRYGYPTYCQLAESCAEEIISGADDESEMGAFHDLYQTQRITGLRARLEEYTPAGGSAGVIIVS